jgi:hypothetical protein
VAEERQTFWDRFFGGRLSGGNYQEERERRVIEYIIHRIGEGARLGDVVQEEYVRRHASPDEVRDILDSPELIEAAHEKLREDFSSGRLDPKPPPSAAR